MTYIYGIKDSDSNKIKYVGKANDPFERFKRHIKVSLKRPYTRFHKWLSRNTDNCELLILEQITSDEWQDAERFWISYLNFVGAELKNMTPGGDGHYKLSQEIRSKISKSNTGKALSLERKLQIGLFHKGRKRSIETRIKLSESAKKRGVSKEQIEKLIEGRRKMENSGNKGKRGALAWNKGLTTPDDVKAKQREAKIGKPLSESHKENISKSLKGIFVGREISEEQKKAISKTNKEKGIKPPSRKGYRKINREWIKPVS